MALQHYLPSAKFAVMAGALVLSGGLVAGAKYVTRPPIGSAALTQVSQDQQQAQAQNWQQALQDVEAQSGVTAPQPPDPNVVNSFLAAAKSPNLTTQIGRSLFINLSSASSQGLGQDAPTQDELVAQAAAQITVETASSSYSAANITKISQTPSSLKAYGNAVMQAIAAHPAADVNATYIAIGGAVDAQDAAPLNALPPIGQAYLSLGKSLASVPVPETLAPLHLELINDLSQMGALYPDMGQIIEDPLRGMAALQQYSSLTDETKRVLTNIAQALDKDGIIFSKDEPGGAWSAFLST